MAQLPATTAKGNGRTITFADTDDWGSGFIGSITIAVTNTIAISGWTLSFDVANDITNIWNAQIISHVGTHYVIGNVSNDAAIAAGGSVSIGFQATGGNPVLPTQYTLNGTTIGSGSSASPPLPNVTISDGNVTETGAATLNETFTVKLSSASTSPVTVQYHTVDGTAHAGVDYNAATGTLSFAAGQTSGTITIATHPGATGSLAYTIVLGAPSGATIADGSAIGTIVNPAPTPPAISIVGAKVNESGVNATGSLLPSGFLSTKGNQIVDAAGNPVKIAAVNWFGMETSSFVPQGLWTQNYQSMMRQMESLGFNAIRLPFSLQAFDSGSVPNGIDYSINPDLKGLNALQILDKIVGYANQIGMKIILDDHRSAAGSGPNADGLWYDSGYTEAQWISTWKMLASHYAGNTAIIGADLSNEPHNPATWGDGGPNDWAAAATRAGDAIQTVNPNWLIMVEGIQTYQGSSTWWGGNLMGVQSHPITLTDPNKLVYSPHDYPASVYQQSWLSASNYPNNLPSVWNQYWGYIYQNGTAPVFVGEFGSKLQTTSDQQWMSQIVSYMNKPGGVGGAQGISWAYWDWNPTSGDTGGILNNDWITVDQTKLNAIAPAMYHTSATLPTEVDFSVSLSKASVTPVTVHYTTMDGTAKAGIDYVATSGDLTFAPGETAKIVAAHLLSDPKATGQIQFMMALSSPSGATLAASAATAVLDHGSTSLSSSGSTSTGTSGSGSTSTSGSGSGTTTTPTGTATLQVTSNWGSGLTATVTVSDTSATAAGSWQVEIDTADLITNLWNGTMLSHVGNTYVVGNASWNAAIPSHGSTNFGFQADTVAGAQLSAHLLKMAS